MSAEEQLKEQIEREHALRRTVLRAIERLSETVSVDEMLQIISQMDVTSWDEVMEERDIGGLCGLPVCCNASRPKTNQKYHIDRQVKKIYEIRHERYRFCSDNCFEHAASVRAQLPDQPLWIRGDGLPTKVIPFNWTQQGPSTPVVREKKKEEAIKSGSSNSGEVEIVAPKIMAKLDSLVIAERDASSSESEDEEKCYEDKEFLASIKRFISQKEAGSSSQRAQTNEGGEHGKTKSVKEKIGSDKEAALERLRAKYATSKKMNAVKIIEAPRLSQKQVRETVHSDIAVEDQDEAD